jgi:hypothetical protein
MKKFVLVHIGFEQPTQEVMIAWEEWFQSIADITIENVGLGPAKEITSEGVKDLPFDRSAVTGYSVIKANDMDEAVRIAQACPFITGIGVYEVREMG